MYAARGGWREEGEQYQVPCLQDTTHHAVGNTFQWSAPPSPQSVVLEVYTTCQHALVPVWQLITAFSFYMTNVSKQTYSQHMIWCTSRWSPPLSTEGMNFLRSLLEWAQHCHFLACSETRGGFLCTHCIHVSSGSPCRTCSPH